MQITQFVTQQQHMPDRHEVLIVDWLPPVADPLAVWLLMPLQGQGLRTVELTLDELKTRFKKHVIASTVQCGGNRRNEMKAVQPVKGLDWDAGAIGTATFGGVLLRDVLQYAGERGNWYRTTQRPSGRRHAAFATL